HSVHHFWNLLTKSGLIPQNQVVDLRQEFAQIRGSEQANPPLLAEWLVSKAMLTRLQANSLLGADNDHSSLGSLGDFQLQEKLAKGRYQGYYRAVHQPSDHKVLLGNIEQANFYFPEAWPTICKIYSEYLEVDSSHLAGPLEFVHSAGHYYVVMDDLGGTALSEVLFGGQQLSLSVTAAIAESVAHGLVALHAAGIAHGDVQPRNIYLPRKGHARLLILPETLAMHTPNSQLDLARADYAAPELDPMRATPTKAADIYALGCTIYQILSGHPPFMNSHNHQDSIANKLQRHATEPIVPLDQNLAVPSAFNQIVSYMMAKDTAVRYASAETLIETLHRFVDPVDVPRDRPSADTYHLYLSAARQRRKQVICDPLAASPSLLSERGEAVDGNWDGFFRQTDRHIESDALSVLKDSIHQSAETKPRRSRRVLLYALGLTTAILLAVALILLPQPENRNSRNSPETISDTPKVADSMTETTEKDLLRETIDQTATERELPDEPPHTYEDIVEDDGKLLWSSPTRGGPPDIRYLPPNPKILFMIHPEGLIRKGNARSILEALGPFGEEFQEWIETETGFSPNELTQLDVALYDDPDGGVQRTLVVHLPKNYSLDELLRRWGNPTEEIYNGTRYYLSGERAFYLPANRSDVFAIARIENTKQVIDFLDEPSWLSTPMQSLAESADTDRHVNIFFSTNFVRSSRETLYPGPLAPLHTAVSWFLGPGEDVQAGLLSFHFTDIFFSEMCLYPARDKMPKAIASEFYNRLSEMSRQLNIYLLELSISDYSRDLLASFPDMLRCLYESTRHDRNRAKGRHAVLRACLPEAAGAYLAMGGELTLLETSTAVPKKSDTKDQQLTLEQKLSQLKDLVISRDSLLEACRLLGQELRIPIIIQGKDLEKEGITKNQALGIDMRNQSGRDILIQILLEANPAKNLSGPDDPELKLIYVLPKGSEEIWITTRSAASERGDEIPAIFQSSP
ncbi:MAG: protein kinase, partial [Pirellulales bacterium]|nr:protein kinase [Pirellulales bacterium]